MELIPAIDLLGGKVVRLAQGDYDRVTDYGDDPVAVARSWVAQGATRLHLVDLEAARDGTRSQAGIIARVVLGGGRALPGRGWHPRWRHGCGAARCRRGQGGAGYGAHPAARTSGRALVRRWGAPRIVAAVDVRDGRAVGDGWTAGAAGTPALELIARLAADGLALFAVTAIARDGLLTGPDMDLLASSAEIAGDASRIIASAGVSSLDDIRALAAARYGGAILGRALYEARIDLAEALALAMTD